MEQLFRHPSNSSTVDDTEQNRVPQSLAKPEAYCSRKPPRNLAVYELCFKHVSSEGEVNGTVVGILAVGLHASWR